MKDLAVTNDSEQTELPSERLAAARAGSHTAFRSLVEPYQEELRRHCYRMTGSVDDADDIVQETLFRAWRGLGTYHSRGSFRAWLYRIATNRTLDLLKSAPRKREVINSANEPPWLQPYPSDESDSIEHHVTQVSMIGLAFVAALQNLPGRQRASLILRDVLSFSAAETAAILDCTVAATNSALQRARATMATTQPAPGSSAPTAEQRAITERFLQAWKAADTGTLVALLNETVHMTMPPHQLEVFGSHDTVGFLLDIAPDRDPDRLRFAKITANGECGLAMYLADEATGAFHRHCLMLFHSSDAGIDKITGFTEDRIFELLDLPTSLDP